jgi:hypothetical protein
MTDPSRSIIGWLALVFAVVALGISLMHWLAAP